MIQNVAKKTFFESLANCNFDVMHNPEKEILAFEIRHQRIQYWELRT